MLETVTNDEVTTTAVSVTADTDERGQDRHAGGEQRAEGHARIRNETSRPSSSGTLLGSAVPCRRRRRPTSSARRGARRRRLPSAPRRGCRRTAPGRRSAPRRAWPSASLLTHRGRRRVSGLLTATPWTLPIALTSVATVGGVGLVGDLPRLRRRTGSGRWCRSGRTARRAGPGPAATRCRGWRTSRRSGRRAWSPRRRGPARSSTQTPSDQPAVPGDGAPRRYRKMDTRTYLLSPTSRGFVRPAESPHCCVADIVAQPRRRGSRRNRRCGEPQPDCARRLRLLSRNSARAATDAALEESHSMRTNVSPLGGRSWSAG